MIKEIIIVAMVVVEAWINQLTSFPAWKEFSLFSLEPLRQETKIVKTQYDFTRLGQKVKWNEDSQVAGNLYLFRLRGS